MFGRGRIVYEDGATLLRQRRDGTLVLGVLCGRVGQFGVEFELNELERDEYRIRGEEFVKSLAQAVKADPEAFLARGRSY